MGANLQLQQCNALLTLPNWDQSRSRPVASTPISLTMSNVAGWTAASALHMTPQDDLAALHHPRARPSVRRRQGDNVIYSQRINFLWKFENPGRDILNGINGCASGSMFSSCIKHYRF